MREFREKSEINEINIIYMRIGVIFGGKSGEHEVSIVSAASIMKAMDKEKYEIVPIGITKDGRWFTGKNVLEVFREGKYEGLVPIALHTDPGNKGFLELDEGARHEKLDLVFPVLHGPYGEDGTIQGLLEMMNIPYVGCGVLASALCMDKLMTKAVLENAGVLTVPYLAVSRKVYTHEAETISNKIAQQINFPCFVKPANMGSSVGITKVKHFRDLEAAILEAMKYDRKILVEKGIDAREIEVAVLGNDDAEASECGEIIVGGEFYDYHDKYVDGKSSTRIPADLPNDVAEKIRKMCVKAYKLLDCCGLARVDSFIDRQTGDIYLNEINTMPGFTSISMYPKMWEASGLNYAKLIDRLIELALERFDDKQKNKIEFHSGSDWHKF